MPGTPGPGKSITIMHWCEPEWHYGQDIPADYVLNPMPDNRNPDYIGFACCASHLGRAVEISLGKVNKVTIHRVNSRA